MFGIGFSEIILTLAVTFVVLGPKRAVDAAYKMGVWLRRTRTQFNDLKQKEMGDWDSTPLYDAKIELNKTLADLKDVQKLP